MLIHNEVSPEILFLHKKSVNIYVNLYVAKKFGNNCYYFPTVSTVQRKFKANQRKSKHSAISQKRGLEKSLNAALKVERFTLKNFFF
jgi:hypothetical protein